MRPEEVVAEIKLFQNRRAYFEVLVNDLINKHKVNAVQAYSILEQRAEELGLGTIYKSLDSFYMSRHRYAKERLQ